MTVPGIQGPRVRLVPFEREYIDYALRWFNDPDLTMRFIGAAGATLQLLLVILAILLWRAGEGVAGSMLRRALANGGGAAQADVRRFALRGVRRRAQG